MFVRRAVTMRIADVFPLVGAESADVGGIRKLLLVVVFVIPTGSPIRIAISDEILPGSTLGFRERRSATDLQNGRGKIEGESLGFDCLCCGGESGIANHQRDAY